jgi:hypothetical protein
MTEKPDEKKSDEKRFNDTLKRMLKTPPKPHDEKKAKPKVPARPDRKRTAAPSR